MASRKPKRSLFKRIKSFLLSAMLIIIVIQGIILYRLYSVHIDKKELSVNEFDEVVVSGSDLGTKLKRLRNSFSDTSAEAWAAAQGVQQPRGRLVQYRVSPPGRHSGQEKFYEIAIDVPGVDIAELSVTISDLTVSVTGIRQRSETSGELLMRERFRGEFVRSFDLPGKIDGEGIKATVAEGILRIVIPKGESDDLDIPVKVTPVALNI